MIIKNKIVELLPWDEFLDVHIKKDPGLFPLFISKEYNILTEIIYIKCNNKSTQKTIISDNCKIKGLQPTYKKKITNLTDPRRLLFLFPLIKYIFKNRKKISHYILFHANENSLTLAFFIKLFSPRAKIWLKLDANYIGLKNFLIHISLSKTIKQKILNKRYRYIFKKIDLISAETKKSFLQLKNNQFMNTLNIQIIPNGLNLLLQGKPQKENLIISVARFGTFPKNTELLLDIFSSIRLKKWKVLLIGPIEQSFKAKIDHFFITYPKLKKSIIFTGNISDINTITTYYQKAKIFILPSRYEGFALAPLEALSYGDYLILTNVGAAEDLIINSQIGFIIPDSEQDKQKEDIMKVAVINELQSIIDNKKNINTNVKQRINIAKEFYMTNIIKKPYFKQWLGL